MQEIIMYLGLGAVVGFLSGLLGVGGGGILVPILTSIFTFYGIGDTQSLQVALATSLACALSTTATSAYSHHKKGAVLWQIVKPMSIGIIIGTVIGISIATQVNALYLAILFTIFMFVTALKMFSNWQPTPRDKPLSEYATGITGAIIGMSTALISVGAAFFSIIYLTYNNIDIKKAIGTSSAVGFISFACATLGYVVSNSAEIANMPYSIGYIYLPALGCVSLASVLMVPIGTKIAHNLPNKKLQKILGVLCLFLSIKMLFSMIG